MTRADAHEISFDPDGFWRMRNARRLSPPALAILRQLYLYRDQQARQMDRPAFKVISDKTLVEIAEKSPKDLQQLGEISGMTKGQVRRHGKALLAAVQRGREAKPPRYPRSKNNHNEEISNRYDQLHTWRKNTAKARQVESDVILPRDIMKSIAIQNPRQPGNLKQLMGPLEIRFDRYGRQILKVIQEI
jgi:ribonuclease D